MSQFSKLEKGILGRTVKRVPLSTIASIVIDVISRTAVAVHRFQAEPDNRLESHQGPLSLALCLGLSN
jgi:hypothetical protein